MSRGLGRVQRAVLEYLSGDPMGTFGECGPVDVSITETARAVFGASDPSAAQLASVRRAARQLAAAGLIVSNGRRGWDARPDRQYVRAGREVQLSETFIQRLPTVAEQRAEARAMRRMGL